MRTNPARGPAADPRPLIGEPLPLDLLNTRWIDDGTLHDLLRYPDGLAIWLHSADLGEQVPATEETLHALLATRTALASLVDSGAGGQAAAEDLNETLRHGRIRRLLDEDGPRSVVETDSPGWLAAWTAAEVYLQLLDENPERIRKCANPECVLHFYDVSKNGGRRWCSMVGCGNRAKAHRHYSRRKQATDG
ncbi:CGNR zinc finger domain-containing protein [Streptomyces sp. NPDC008121]|uniref:CGNR zinc finger domain-containing protein n=1 Tax=Streptomyces sp. NPDC008121 TaxID=3364809 RepID=UPI0036EAA40F